MFKLVTGTCADVDAHRIRCATAPTQHGMGGEHTAARMVWHLSGAMASHPEDVFWSIDCTNAFGTLRRSKALQAADIHAPHFAALLRATWTDVSPTLLIDVAGNDTLSEHMVVDALTQGGCDAQPAFCLGLSAIIADLSKWCQSHGIPLTVWAYIDDVQFQFPAVHAAKVSAHVDSLLAEAGLERNLSKCKWHIPDSATSDAFENLSGIATLGQRCTHGLPVLGAIAGGAYATIVSPAQTDLEQPESSTGTSAAQCMQARIDAAVALTTRIIEMIRDPGDFPRAQAAWRLLVGVVNEAVSYDLCILPPAVTAACADRLDTLVLTTATHIFGHDLIQHSGLHRLSRARGGFGVVPVATRAYTAFLAAVLANPAPPRATEAEWNAAAISTHAQACIDWLAAHQVFLDEWGSAHHLPPPVPLVAASLPRYPIIKCQRGWKDLLDRHLADALRDQIPYLDSRAGLEGGAFLHATPAEIGYQWNDSQWIVAARWRMGLRTCAVGCCTHLRMTDRDGRSARSRCLVSLDQVGYHAAACNIGGGVTAIHDAIRDRLHDAGRAAGYRSLVEQVIPLLATPKRGEPRVDVEAWGHTFGQDRLLDVTVCAPWAHRYAKDPCAATTSAERRKNGSYPTVGGIGVTGVAVDLFGRFGPQLTELLEEWASLARARDTARGVAPRRWMHIWRTQIAAAIARGVARQISASQRWPTPAAATGGVVQSCILLPPQGLGEAGRCAHDIQAATAPSPPSTACAVDAALRTLS